MNRFRIALLAVAGFALASAVPPAANAAGGRYQQDNLVSDGSVPARHTDANLVNGWGVAFNPNGFVWVSANGTGVSTLYDGSGNPQSLVVTIPSAAGGSSKGKPTGIVFSGSNDFVVRNGTLSAPARFIFSTEDGLIAGWAPTVDATHALPVARAPGAVYKGLALAGNGAGNFLYAADFVGRKIDVYDRTFQPVAMPGGFVDPSIPASYSPFNIQNIQGDLYVAYAKREPGEDEETTGPGLGFINVFDANGQLLRRVASRGKLNAPWGMALAPASFGRFANRLLVGNFGDGTINAYDARSGAFRGQLRGADGRTLKIDGLWGLAFGNGIQNQPTSTLFFAAGPDDENHGLYGAITPIAGSRDDDSDDDD